MYQTKNVKNHAEQFHPKKQPAYPYPPKAKSSPNPIIHSVPKVRIPAPQQQYDKVGLLKYSLEMRHLTIKQIEKRFFGGKTAHSEIESLLSEGLLRKKDDVVKYGSVLIPTQKAFDLVKSQVESSHLLPEPLSQVWSPRVNHDTILGDIRIKFEGLNFVTKWYSDLMMEKVGGLPEIFLDLPDACCRKTNGRAYFLELEISQKSRAKYIERIHMYEEIFKIQEIQNQKIDGVMFLCTDSKVVEILKDLTKGNSRHFSVFHTDRYLGSNSQPNLLQSRQGKLNEQPAHAV